MAEGGPHQTGEAACVAPVAELRRQLGLLQGDGGQQDRPGVVRAAYTMARLVKDLVTFAELSTV